MSIPDDSVTGTGRVGADLPEMTGSANRTDDLGVALSTDIYPAILPGVNSVANANMGLPGFSKGMREFLDAAMRIAVNQVAQDLADQADATRRGVATFEITDDELRANAAKVSDQARSALKPEVAW